MFHLCFNYLFHLVVVYVVLVFDFVFLFASILVLLLVLILCFATWTTWVPKINTCWLTLTIPVIFTNILCDLYTLSYDQVKKHFGYMIYSRDDHSRLKNIYTKAQVKTLRFSATI